MFGHTNYLFPLRTALCLRSFTGRSAIGQAGGLRHDDAPPESAAPDLIFNRGANVTLDIHGVTRFEISGAADLGCSTVRTITIEHRGEKFLLNLFSDLPCGEPIADTPYVDISTAELVHDIGGEGGHA